jgi:hypothetical protein
VSKRDASSITDGRSLFDNLIKGLDYQLGRTAGAFDSPEPRNKAVNGEGALERTLRELHGHSFFRRDARAVRMTQEQVVVLGKETGRRWIIGVGKRRVWHVQTARGHLHP